MWPVRRSLRQGLYLATKMLFCILFASFGGLADFLANLFPLVRLVLFNGIEKGLALPKHQIH